MDETLFQESVAHLRNADPKFARLIARIGEVPLPRERDPWKALTGSIIGQQISVAAARAIRNRFSLLVSERDYPTPIDLLGASDEALRAVGLSRNKILALRDLARHFEEEKIQPHRFAGMSDEEVIEVLLPVRGIGRWTAEMFLLFSLGRPDVFAVGDLGLRNAIWKLYELPEAPAPKLMREIALPWRPFRSVASWYLWRSLGNQPVVD